MTSAADYERALRHLEEMKMALAALRAEVNMLMFASAAAENEHCAQLVERMGTDGFGTLAIAAAVRQRVFDGPDRSVH
jgi:hypothetical protein